MLANLEATTLLIPQYELGQKAVSLLAQKIERPTPRQPTTRIPFGFAEGRSCVPPTDVRR
jgi:DNA-binding LacI/PurR family transcriptional regulator